MSVQRTPVAVTGVHCYFGSSMCLSNWGLRFPRFSLRDSACFWSAKESWRMVTLAVSVWTPTPPHSLHSPTPHISILIYEGQNEQEMCAALVPLQVVRFQLLGWGSFRVVWVKCFGCDLVSFFKQIQHVQLAWEVWCDVIHIKIKWSFANALIPVGSLDSVFHGALWYLRRKLSEMAQDQESSLCM